MTLTIRDARETDVGFIISAWLTSAGKAWEELRNEPSERFVGVPVRVWGDVPHRFTRNAVAEILQRPTTRCLVACDDDDEDVILGFVVAEPERRIVHWLHTKHLLRRQGVGTELLAAALPTWGDGLTCTYLGRGFLGWAKRMPLRFDPHAGRARAK